MLLADNYSDIPSNLMTLDCIEPSRSYPSFPPKRLYNNSIVDKVWRDKSERIFGRKEAALPPKIIASINNAILFGNGHVALPDGRIMADTVLESSVNLATNSVIDDLEVIKGEYALLRKPGDSNFGHWMIELLPRVIDFGQILGPEIKFLIPQNPFSMLPLRRRSMELLGIGEDRIITINTNPKRVEKLHFISANSIHSHTHDAVPLKTMVALLKKPCFTRRQKHRLFVRRGSGLRRKLTNEDEILHVAKKNNFKFVYPERLSIEEQIDLFSQATLIAGESGAALTNIIWAPPKTPILSMLPNIGHEFFFWDLANIFDLNFSFMYGQCESPKDLGHSDFFIIPELFQSWINEFET